MLLAALLPTPTRPTGALTSLLSPKGSCCFLGVMAPAIALRARPLRSLICASACSRVIVGVRAGLFTSNDGPLVSRPRFPLPLVSDEFEDDDEDDPLDGVL